MELNRPIASTLHIEIKPPPAIVAISSADRDGRVDDEQPARDRP